MESHEPSPTTHIVKFESTTSPLFSSAIPKTPFAFPCLRPSRVPHVPLVDIPLIVKELKQSATKMIHSFVDSNPLLRHLASVSSQFNHFCKVRMQREYSYNLGSRAGNFAAILPGDSVAGMVVTNGILNFLNIYNTILVCRLVLTWFPNAPPAIVSPLSTLCDPYLNIFRGLIPPLGGTLDLSPILAFLVLNAFTSTASALPAELPPSMRSQSASAVHETHASYTTSQEKWIRRFRGNDSHNKGGIN